MNSRAHLIRRLVGDLVQRLRIALGTSGADANVIVDQLTRDFAEDLTVAVCASLGVEYEGQADVPRRRSDGRKAPWGRKGVFNRPPRL